MITESHDCDGGLVSRTIQGAFVDDHEDLLLTDLARFNQNSPSG